MTSPFLILCPLLVKTSSFTMVIESHHEHVRTTESFITSRQVLHGLLLNRHLCLYVGRLSFQTISFWIQFLFLLQIGQRCSINYLWLAVYLWGNNIRCSLFIDSSRTFASSVWRRISKSILSLSLWTILKDSGSFSVAVPLAVFGVFIVLFGL